MRKGKIIRSYNQSYYVVTPSKYLHEFKDLDVRSFPPFPPPRLTLASQHLNREPEPELSLYLPDTVLSALNSEGKFQITGKDAGSKLSTKHEYAFKASSHDEGQRWYEAISACVNHKSDLAPAVTPPGGASTVAIEPPAYDKTPPAVTGQQSGVTTAAVPVVAEKAA